MLPIRSAVFLSCAVAAIASQASAATPGFYEDFQSGLNGWGSNPSIVTHIATNGADGPSDGFAMVEGIDLPTEMIVRTSSSMNSDVTGDFIGAGITQISFALNELGVDDGLIIRFGFGQLGNFWVSNQMFDPSADTWDTFTVDLIESNFTEVFGFGGTFEAAMSNAQRVQFRLDYDEPGIMPDVGQGDFGLDSIRMIPTPGAAGLLAMGGVVAVRRRR